MGLRAFVRSFALIGLLIAMGSGIRARAEWSVGEILRVEQPFSGKLSSSPAEQELLREFLPGERLEISARNESGEPTYSARLVEPRRGSARGTFDLSKEALEDGHKVRPILDAAAFDAIPLQSELERVLAPLAPEECAPTAAQLDLAQRLRRFTKAGAKAVEAGRKVIASFYQSCKALGVVIDPETTLPQGFERRSEDRFISSSSLKKFIDQNPILSALAADLGRGAYPGPGCENVLPRPPVYAYGAKSKVRDGKAETYSIDLSKSGCGGNGVVCGSVPVTGLDCSGFVALSYAAAGLRFSSNERIQPDALAQPGGPSGTGWFAEVARKPGSCLESVRFDPSSSSLEALKPGDLVITSGGHVIMVEETSPDPFGISAVGDCDDLTAADFQFSYLHSGAIGDMGLARVNARLHGSPAFRNPMIRGLEETARRLCKARAEGDDRSFTAAGAPQFSILRHKGESVPGCKVEPVAVEGEGCVRACG